MRGDSTKEIKSDRVVLIGGVEVDDVVAPASWDVIEEVFGEIAVGVDDTDAMAGFDVLEDEVPKESGLA